MSDGLILTDIKGKDYPRERCPEESLRHPARHRGQDSHGSPAKAELMEVIDEVVISRERISRGIEIATPKDLYLLMTAAPFYSQDLRRRFVRHRSDLS